MGCTSSTEVVVDPHTGKAKKKTKLGGAYPGQRRPNHAPYVPPASEFGKDGQATVHFIAYGGGNALTLVKQDGSHQPQTGAPQAEFIEVTLPDGVTEGQTIHVQAPDGRLNAIVVPPGFGPGSTFTVEFAPEEAPPPPSTAPMAAATASAPPAKTDNHADDGFATGFNNPNWTPPPPTATATAVSEPEIDMSSYPTTSAAPVYSAPPKYPSK